MERQLLWGGRIHTVAIPLDLTGASERDIWTYVQHYISNGSLVEKALYDVFQARYHGIGWASTSSADTKIPIPYGLSVFGEFDADASPSSHGKSSRAGPSRNRSQKPSVRPSSQGMKNVESGTEDRHRHSAPRTTSIASPPSVPAVKEAHRVPVLRKPMRTAKPHTAVPWAGRTTKSSVSPVVPPA